jgi:large subunit ribosomal protein L18
MLTEIKRQKNRARHVRSRKKVIGTVERPRLHVFRSHLHLYAQAIDDMEERTLCTSSTQSAELKKKKKKQWGNVAASKEFGVHMAELLKKKKINRIVFDRAGRPFQGRLRAFAQSLRDNGIQF